MTPEEWERIHARNTDPWTSHVAAEFTANKATIMVTLERAFMGAWRKGMDGLTQSEVARAAGYTDSDGAWKRVSDLLAENRIEVTGWTRLGPSGRPQRVYRWVPPNQRPRPEPQPEPGTLF